MGKVDFGLIISLLKQFSNREIAIAIWILVFLIGGLTQYKSRELFCRLVTSFFASKLTLSFFAMLSYIGVMLIVLSAVGIWHVSNVANTILWIVFVAFAMLFEMKFPRFNGHTEELG